MEIISKTDRVVTINMSDREAKLLACLIGAMSPMEAERLIEEQSAHFSSWIGKLEQREMIEFTGRLYDGLYDNLQY